MTAKEKLEYSRALSIEIEGAFGACETVYGYTRESMAAAVLNILGVALGALHPKDSELYQLSVHTILGSAIGKEAGSMANIDVIKAITKFMDANARDLATERLTNVAGEDGINYLVEATKTLGIESINSIEDLEERAAKLAAFVKKNNPELYKKLTPTADNKD